MRGHGISKFFDFPFRQLLPQLHPEHQIFRAVNLPVRQVRLLIQVVLYEPFQVSETTNMVSQSANLFLQITNLFLQITNLFLQITNLFLKITNLFFTQQICFKAKQKIYLFGLPTTCFGCSCSTGISGCSQIVAVLLLHWSSVLAFTGVRIVATADAAADGCAASDVSSAAGLLVFLLLPSLVFL